MRRELCLGNKVAMWSLVIVATPSGITTLLLCVIISVSSAYLLVVDQGNSSAIDIDFRATAIG